MTERVFLGIGSNTGDSINILSAAITSMHDLIGPIQAISPLYRSAPVGPVVQNDFLNAAVCICTELEPMKLLHQTQYLEQCAGRQRLIHWGPRTLDIDILIYGNLKLNLPGLILPHPQMLHRHFVLRPLKDLSELLGIDVLPDLDQHLQHVSNQDIQCLDQHWCHLV